jgi:NAD(P)-dependent dehydrogenase (short-subunit alcohol dehydrogenase family)
VITGANRGLGFALARLCSEQGYRVFAGCRSLERSAALEELKARFPDKVTIIPLDITDEEYIQRSRVIVGESVDGLDLLINNAAVHEIGETIKNFSGESALEQLRVNAVGQLLVVKQFIDLLKAGNDPKVLNISSESGSISRMTSFRGYYYFGSKAALNMYTRALAWDPEMHGVTVVAIHPGWVRTDMGGSAAPIKPEESAASIFRLAEGLASADNGRFFTWDGRKHAW